MKALLTFFLFLSLVSYYNLYTDSEQMKKMYKDEIIALNTHTLEVSAYTASPLECDSTPAKTATNERPMVGGTVAVSRDLMHLLGRDVYIEGIGVRRVNDLMNSRYEGRLDLLVGSVREAKRWGVRERVVSVL